jgi:arylsulfatase A-like enzyme
MKSIKSIPMIAYIILLLVLLNIVIFSKIYSIEKSKKLNIILISIDALRSDHMGIYGYHKNTTPNIDNFFKDAYVFTNTYTGTPKTYASLVSMFAGLEPAYTKLFNYTGTPLASNIDTVTKVLKKSGFTTGAFITNNFIAYTTKGKLTNLQLGFDNFSYLKGYYQYNFSPLFDYYTPGKTANRNYLETSLGKFNSWIDKNKKNKIFAWFHLIDPHAPYIPPQWQLCRQNKKYCNKATYEELVISRELQREKNKGQPSGCSTKTESKADNIAIMVLYDEEIEYTDRLVGTIFKTLEKQGLVENSIIVLTTDHGEGFDHDYYFQHGTLYDSNVKLPLLIKFPGKKGYREDRLIQNTDILPTLLALAGRKINNQNTSQYLFTDVFEKNIFNFFGLFNKTRPFVIGYNHFLKYFSLTTDEYKYIYSKEPNCLYTGSTEELYNLKNDQQDMNNVAEIEKEVKQELREKLMQYLKKAKIN